MFVLQRLAAGGINQSLLKVEKGGTIGIPPAAISIDGDSSSDWIFEAAPIPPPFGLGQEEEVVGWLVGWLAGAFVVDKGRISVDWTFYPPGPLPPRLWPSNSPPWLRILLLFSSRCDRRRRRFWRCRCRYCCCFCRRRAPTSGETRRRLLPLPSLLHPTL